MNARTLFLGRLGRTECRRETGSDAFTWRVAALCFRYDVRGRAGDGELRFCQRRGAVGVPRAGGGGARRPAAPRAGGGRSQSFGVTVRPGVVLEHVWAMRATSGLGSEGGANRYSATYNGVAFDGSSTDVSGVVDTAVSDPAGAKGGFVKFSASGAGT